MTRSEARKDKDFAFGENILNNHCRWKEIKNKLDNDNKLPKIEFLSTRRENKVVSTLIIRSDKERELPFNIPQEAITAEVGTCEESKNGGTFEWYKSFPQRLSSEYLAFLMINDDAINAFVMDTEIEERHYINEQLYL